MMNGMQRAWLVVAIAASTGCIGVPEEHGRRSTAEVPEGTQPLEHVRSDEWTAAPSSCEARLPEDVEFRVTSDGRLVALDASGAAVCTDNVEDVQEELLSTGRVEESRRLGDAYLVSVGLAVPSVRAGDPSPQPSREVCPVRSAGDAHGRVRDDGVREGDPSPQPSSQPREECRTDMLPRR